MKVLIEDEETDRLMKGRNRLRRQTMESLRAKLRARVGTKAEAGLRGELDRRFRKLYSLRMKG